MRLFAGLMIGLVLGGLATFVLKPPVIQPPTVQIQSPLPPVNPAPTAVTIQVDLERARLVHRTVYSEMGFTVHREATERRMFGLLQSGRLIIMSGTCTAGMDYDEKPPVVEVTGTRVWVKLPDAKILGCGSTNVSYFDGKGIIPASTEISNQLYSEATSEVRTRASESDILARARENAKAQVELYLWRLGFQQVTVEIAADA